MVAMIFSPVTKALFCELLLFAALAQAHDQHANGVAAAQYDYNVAIDWETTTAISNTTATLQVVSNPILNRKISPVAPQLLDNLRDLQADLVRYVPWFPYPHYGVAELEPPNTATRTTFWKFTEELVQMFQDVFDAVVTNSSSSGERRLVVNFSTQPTWMFNTSTWDYNPDPNRVDWEYPRGEALPNSAQLVADYYGRLASWIIHGEFQDEFGNTIQGGPAYGDAVTHWEIFNEPEAEHKLVGQAYNDFFDAIVRTIRNQVDSEHKISFTGMALAFHNEFDFWETFLTPSKHAADVRDAVANGMASFHFYAKIGSRTNVSTYADPFTSDQLPKFFQEVDHIVALRNQLNPTTQLSLNEAGVIPPGDLNDPYVPLKPIYYNMVAALYIVLVSELSIKGVEVVGSSQYCGIPPLPDWNMPDAQFPGVSMTSWTTGQGNPRYWALKLYIRYFGPGDKIVQTTTSMRQNDGNQANVYVQARITGGEDLPRYTVIVVNKSLQTQTITLPDLEKEATVHIVDEETGDETWKTETLWGTQKLTLGRFAVAVVDFGAIQANEIAVHDASLETTTS